MRKLKIVIYLITSLALLVFTAVFFVGLFSPAKFYPYTEALGPEKKLHMHILMSGSDSQAQCNQILAAQSASLKAAFREQCPDCQIRASSCLDTLSDTQQQWLSDSPIDTPSLRLAYGVIVIQYPLPEVARMICQQSDANARENPPIARQTCYLPNVSRPLSPLETSSQKQRYLEHFKSVGIMISIGAAILLFMVSIQAVLPKLSQTPPNEKAPVGIRKGHIPKLKLSNILKRALDIVISALLLLTLLPLFLCIALLIVFLEGPPIFYVSRRFIALEHSITIYKFRTMVKDATSPKYALKERFMRDGYLDIPLSCEVYTPIGRILERCQFVELLQLLNILFDGMSFVGNRPLPKENLDLLKKFHGWHERFDSPAGITGISQVVGKYGLTPQRRITLERMYSSIYVNADGNILICDLYIIACTLRLLVTGRHLEYDKAVEILVTCGADAYPES